MSHATVFLLSVAHVREQANTHQTSVISFKFIGVFISYIKIFSQALCFIRYSSGSRTVEYLILIYIVNVLRILHLTAISLFLTSDRAPSYDWNNDTCISFTNIKLNASQVI
jgi:hypothetical protein